MKRTTLLNTISVILLQVATIASNFIIPNLILSTFGSEVNGLIATLTQLLNYVALVEGGLSGVIMANLYRPLLKHDYEKVSSVIKASQKTFRRISFIFVAYTFVLAVVFPVLFRSSFSWAYVSSMVIILSIKLFVQYCFSFSYKNLLNADKKVYFVSVTQIVLIILDTLSAILIVKLMPNAHVLKLVSAIIFLIQPIMYGKYVRANYELDKNAPVDEKLSKERWDGLAINTAAFIHGNTDITIVSIFNGLKVASVYNIYSLVSVGLKTISQSLWKALGPSTGKLYASGDIKMLNRRFDTFEYITFFMTFFLFSIAGLLITPFVQIYTSGIADADYYQPLFGALILVAEGIYILREPYVNLAYGANKFKDIRLHAIIEAVLNIVISVALVPTLGIVGVAIGTLVAMTYRTLFQILYLRNHLINRPFRKFLKAFFAFVIPTAALVLICVIFLPLNNPSILKWISYAVLYCVMFGATYIVVSLLFFKKELKELKAYIKHE